MEQKIRQLEDRAGLQGDRFLPPQDDDEQSAATRYNEIPTIDLVLLREAPRPQPGGALRLSFHSGESLDWTPGQPWNFGIARAVFLSTVRVARYQVPAVPTAPECLSLHARGSALAAVLAENATLVCANDETPLPFRYEPLRGLIFDKDLAATPFVSSNDFDPFCDECFF
jgi:hypothetical protein